MSSPFRRTDSRARSFRACRCRPGAPPTSKRRCRLGTTQQTVTVEGESPLVETDNSVIANTIDTKQVVNLPLQGRNMFSLAFLTPGWASTGVTTGGISTAVPSTTCRAARSGGAEFDGTQAISNRFRSGGFTYGTSVVQPRMEDVAEMTIQTAQLDLSGNGVSAMRISPGDAARQQSIPRPAVRRFPEHQPERQCVDQQRARNLPRNIVKLNDFGGSVGGPDPEEQAVLLRHVCRVDSTAEHHRPAPAY